MTKVSKLVGGAIVLTASFALAQNKSATSPLTPKTCPAGAICSLSKGTGVPSGTTIGNVTSRPTSQAKPALGRLFGKTLEKATPRPGTPDFLPSAVKASGTQLQ
jgi:hypothetical protein